MNNPPIGQYPAAPQITGVYYQSLFRIRFCTRSCVLSGYQPQRTPPLVLPGTNGHSGLHGNRKGHKLPFWCDFWQLVSDIWDLHFVLLGIVCLSFGQARFLSARNGCLAGPSRHRPPRGWRLCGHRRREPPRAEVPQGVSWRSLHHRCRDRRRWRRSHAVENATWHCRMKGPQRAAKDGFIQLVN